MTRRFGTNCLGLALLSAVSLGLAWQGPSNVQDFKAGDAYREPYQRATELLQTLGAAAGDWVADVGAGSGYYSMRLSGIVGPGGKVFAEDISDSSMRLLRARVKAFDLLNVDVVKGDSDDPRLPAGRLAAILVVDTYHHFAQVQPMLEQMRRALQPGGRLVIVDFIRAEDRMRTRAEQTSRHEIDPKIARGEIEQAGFQFVKCDEQFVKQSEEAPRNSRAFEVDLWLMAVRNAATGPG